MKKKKKRYAMIKVLENNKKIRYNKKNIESKGRKMIYKKKTFIIFILILSILTIFSSASMAISDPITDPNSYKPGGINPSEANVVASKAGIIFNVISTIGIIVAVITIIVIGIKYMIGSVEEKVEYKKTMIPYLIGVVMIGSISVIVRLIASLAANIE